MSVSTSTWVHANATDRTKANMTAHTSHNGTLLVDTREWRRTVVYNVVVGCKCHLRECIFKRKMNETEDLDEKLRALIGGRENAVVVVLVEKGMGRYWAFQFDDNGLLCCLAPTDTGQSFRRAEGLRFVLDGTSSSAITITRAYANRRRRDGVVASGRWVDDEGEEANIAWVKK